MFENQQLIIRIEIINLYHHASHLALVENDEIALNRENDLVWGRTDALIIQMIPAADFVPYILPCTYNTLLPLHLSGFYWRHGFYNSQPTWVGNDPEPMHFSEDIVLVLEEQGFYSSKLGLHFAKQKTTQGVLLGMIFKRRRLHWKNVIQPWPTWFPI